MPYKDPEQKKRWRENNQESVQTSHQKSKMQPMTRTVKLYYGAKNRAKAKGLTFSLTKRWIHDKILKGTCEVSGLPFVLTTNPEPLSPSLDRIDPSLGYTPENTQLVVWVYNAAKNRFSHEDVLKLAEALCQRFPPKKS